MSVNEGQLDLMLHRLFNRIKRNKLITPTAYEKGLARYRRLHPESLEKDKEQINQWLARVAEKRRQEQQAGSENLSHGEDAKVVQALYALRETARAAFMRHPAATEYDFRRCWPSIREEMLKRYALEELTENPALSLGVAGQASEAKGTLVATQEPCGPNLQLLKRTAASD